MKDLSVPTKQHVLGLLFILYKTYVDTIKGMLGLIAIAFIKVDNRNYLWIGVAIFLIIATVFSILKYLRHKFLLEDGRLVIQKGSLFSKEIIIPFDKVQNIDYEQNVVHQIFDVGKLKVDTAGSDKDEVEIHALDLDIIEQIKSTIFEYKQINGSTTKEDELSHVDALATPIEEKKKIFGLDIPDLMLAGITANHLASGFWIIAILMSLLQRLDDIGMDAGFLKDDELRDSIIHDFYIVGFGLAVFLIISIIVSMARMVIVNYDLEFLRINDGFKLTKGLFNKKVSFAKDERIQSINISQIWLRKFVGMIDLKIRMTGDEHKEVNAISIVGMRNHHIAEVTKDLYPDFQISSHNITGINSRYFTYWAGWICGVLIAVGLGTGYFISWNFLIVALIISSIVGLTLYKNQKKIKFFIDDKYVYRSGGAFGMQYKITRIDKLQSVSLQTSPDQRRNHLASVKIMDGGGNTTIPYVDLYLAERIVEYLVWKMNEGVLEYKVKNEK
jgi:putative membrane protein